MNENEDEELCEKHARAIGMAAERALGQLFLVLMAAAQANGCPARAYFSGMHMGLCSGLTNLFAMSLKHEDPEVLASALESTADIVKDMLKKHASKGGDGGEDEGEVEHDPAKIAEDVLQMVLKSRQPKQEEGGK